MKYSLFLLFCISCLAACKPVAGQTESNKNVAPFTAEKLAKAEAFLQLSINHKRSGVQVLGQGEVIKLLTDDNKGSRHQRFILRLNPQQTLLMAHNIDVAGRLNGLKQGDTVTFYGQYEWNNKGGVVHWTHQGHGGNHTNGWLYWQGKKYQ